MNSLLYKIKKNQFGFFVLNAVLFFGIVLLMDMSAGGLLKKYYFKQQSGQQFQTTYSMDNSNAALMVMGSSRANHHYTAAAFENELGMSYYNAGRDGNHIFYHYAVLQSVLKRYTPKIIVLDYYIKDIQKDEESYDRLSSLLPYYASHPEIQEVVALKSDFEKLKLASYTYPFNSSLFTILKGNKTPLTKQELQNKGYQPIHKVWNKPLATEPNSGQELADSNKLKYLNLFIEACNKAGVKLYLVYSPVFFKYSNEPAAMETARQLAAKHKIKFFDFSTDQTYTQNASLFADRSHLNDEGATVFSQKLATLIKQDIINSNAQSFASASK
jgi:hypothetical protein